MFGVGGVGSSQSWSSVVEVQVKGDDSCHQMRLWCVCDMLDHHMSDHKTTSGRVSLKMMSLFRPDLWLKLAVFVQ